MWQSRAEIRELDPVHSAASPAARAEDERRSWWAGEQRAKWAEIGGKIAFRALQEAWEQGLKVPRERVV